MRGSDRKLLRDLLAVQSASRNSDAMIDFTVDALTRAGCRVNVDDGMVFAKKGNLREPVPCYVAHLDTVHDVVDPERYKATHYIDRHGEIIWLACDPVTGGKRGIGGDDKCGIFVTLLAALELPDVQIVLTRDEEIGALGARALSPEVFAAAACLIQADRRGGDEAIINGGFDDIASPAWQDAMTPILERFGYFWSHAGTWTDVVALVDDGIANVSAVNLGAGYHRAHSADEYIVESELDRCAALALDMGAASAGKRWRHSVADSWRAWTGKDSLTKAKSHTAVWLKTKTACQCCPADADVRVAEGRYCIDCWSAIHDGFDSGLSWDNAAALVADANAKHTANAAPATPRQAKTRKKKAAPAEPPELASTTAK